MNPSSRLKKGYSQLRIHQVMIQDRLRTLFYKKAIESNVRKKDVVLDLGCGTGILSFFAAKKGCQKIYAVDKADIIDSAIKTARLNRLEEKIEFIKKDLFRFRPQEPLDLLIHEQIGHFLWDEDLVSKVAYIRNNFLKKNGLIIPSKIDFYLVPTNLESELSRSVRFWSRRRYEVDFRNLAKEAFIQKMEMAVFPSMVKLQDRKTFLCPGKRVYTVDLRRENRIPEEIKATFRLKRGSRLTGMCGYFKIHLDENHVFSTEPRSINTHWGQIFLPSFDEKEIRRDSVLNFILFPKRKPREWRFKFEVSELEKA